MGSREGKIVALTENCLSGTTCQSWPDLELAQYGEGFVRSSSKSMKNAEHIEAGTYDAYMQNLWNASYVMLFPYFFIFSPYFEGFHMLVIWVLWAQRQKWRQGHWSRAGPSLPCWVLGAGPGPKCIKTI